jgi:hypothetical protein
VFEAAAVIRHAIGKSADAPMIDIMVPTKGSRGLDGRLVEPHKRLMAAVLQTVLDDCRGSARRRRAGLGAPVNLRAVRLAIAYVASTDRSWAFSFENLCEALALDPGHLRRELQKVPGVLWDDSGNPTPVRI